MGTATESSCLVLHFLCFTTVLPFFPSLLHETDWAGLPWLCTVGAAQAFRTEIPLHRMTGCGWADLVAHIEQTIAFCGVHYIRGKDGWGVMERERGTLLLAAAGFADKWLGGRFFPNGWLWKGWMDGW